MKEKPKLSPWCDHFITNDSKTEYGYAVSECLKCGYKSISQAFDEWKFCPWCGAHRPINKVSEK